MTGRQASEWDLHWHIEAALETREAMFSDIDWCQGQWCPLPRPRVDDVDRATIEGFGLSCVMEADMWLGLPQFEGFLPERHAHVVLAPRLEVEEGEFYVSWRLKTRGESLLTGLPEALIIDNVDPVACVVEALLEEGRGDPEYPHRREGLDHGAYAADVFKKF